MLPTPLVPDTFSALNKPKTMKSLIALLVFCLAFTTISSHAQERGERPERPRSPGGGPPDTNAPAGRKEDAKDAKSKDDHKFSAALPDASSKPVFTTNTVTIAGEAVIYTVETGMLPLLKTDGGARASVFYIAYTRPDATNRATRPVMFCFNGGPGSSSVWLHLGGLGPRRVKLNDDGTMPPPPFGLVDNEYSILRATDLVFIDPVATGYSRPAKDERADQFFGQTPDVE